jgi:hypothetical protein
MSTIAYDEAMDELRAIEHAQATAWDYRVVEVDGVFTIREVFYDDQGLPQGCLSTPAAPEGESLDELVDDMKAVERALQQPILTLVDGKLVEKS